MQQPTRLISTPFAQEGEKTEIQNVTGEFDNSATYQLGFPPITMQSIRLGGKPPKGTDFNGVLFDITENISFLCKGGRYQYNAGLSTLIGGYPKGSNLLLDDNVTEVVSTVAGNQNNPNTNMTGWILKPNKTTAVNVADASGETQQKVNYNGGSKWHSRVGGYQANERVVLTNGDIVKSTIPNNTNDPNLDMTGWVKTNSASQIFDESGLSQQGINDLNIESSAFNKIHGNVLSKITDVTKFGDYYYFYTGTLPHTVTELTPTSQYKCVGMLNGYPLNHVKNWGIVEDDTDQATKFQFALENAHVDNLVSDGKLISISKVDITTDKAIKILGFSNLRFKPYFTAPEVTKDYLFKVNHSETEWENITIDNPDTGKFLTRIFNITESIRHKFTRIMISCPDYRIGTVFDMGLVKESGFTDLRIDLDATTKQGTIFKSQSCVNNWITGGMYGYGQYFLNAIQTPYDSVVYKSEGWLISNAIAVFFKNPLSVNSITALQATNCIFDFCIERFFEFTLGSHSMISNCWFANDTTSSTTEPMAVVAGNTFDGLTLSANSFINNNGNNATPLFSLNPVPKNNSFINLNRVQGFTKGIILNCEYGNNTFADKDESVQSTVNTTLKMEGLLCEFINKNAFVANSQYYALSFRNKTAESSIVSETGNHSDLTRMRFYTQAGATLKEAMFLHNGEVGMPNLPISSSDAEIGGLYAGADGVVKIRRT